MQLTESYFFNFGFSPFAKSEFFLTKEKEKVQNPEYGCFEHVI